MNESQIEHIAMEEAGTVLKDPFEDAEENLGFKLQPSLKKCLIANGFDSSYIISKIDETDISKTEEFARTTLPELIDENEYEAYYGIFKNKISKFKFLDGHKKQLSLIIEFYKNQLIKTQNTKIRPNSDKLSDKPGQMKNKQPPEKQKSAVKVQIFNTNLTEEKKIIEKNVIEWTKKYDSQKTDNVSDSNLKSETIYNIINNQNISVKLCDEEYDELGLAENASIDESNNIMSDIVCFCGAHTKVFKKVLAGRKNKTWMLSNYYRHLVNHFQNSDKRKSNKKGNQQNTVVNYFTVVNKDIVNKDNIEDNTNKKAIEFESILPEYISELQKVPYSFLKPDVPSKWKDLKYSRQEREKRAREHSLLNDGENQPLITNYFKIVDKINKYINENNIFNESLEDLKNNMPPWEEISVETFIKKTDTSTLLKSICNSALRNSNFPSPNANRYDESLKKFCVFLYFVGGRLLYETLQSNLTNSLPSISSLNRFISTQKQNIVEGEYRFKELKEFLLERNLPLCVWVSEDGTRVMGKIQYDQISDKVIGFVLPFENGMANVNAYLATSANTIGQYFQNNEKANYAYVIMAKPLHENAPTFCLSIFGTNNRFNHKDVINRWNTMEKMAGDFGIKILGYSSDGDTRLLKAMQISTYHLQSTQFFIQDTVHIGTKLRTRFLKPNIVLPIGNFTISVSHLKILLEKFSKDKHLLTLSDLVPEDKMNFRSAEKICAPIVQEMLKHVPQSQGTISFLETMNNVLSSFLDKSLTVEDRIYRIWRSVYFLRIWRYSILKNKEYSLKDNFITTNAYSCIELNALSLILLVKKFRDSTFLLRPYMFIPWHFSSQACEELFRTTRSMTSTFSTVVNFTMKDILQRLKRIELLNMIQNDLHENHQNILQSPNPSHSDDLPNLLNPSQSSYNFPRYKKHTRHFINNTKLQSTEKFETICDKKIEDILAASLNDAKLAATDLGITMYEKSSEKPEYLTNYEKIDTDIQIDNYNYTSQETDNSLIPTPTDSSPIENISDDVCKDLCNISEFGNFGNDLLVKNFSNCKNFINSIDNNLAKTSDQNNPNLKPDLIQITLNNNESLTIKKSSLCWLFDNKTRRVSNDRLRRFVNNTSKKPNTKRKNRGKNECNAREIGKIIKKKKSNLSYEESTPENSDIDDNLTTLCDNDKSLDNNLQYTEQDTDNDNDNATKAQSTTPQLNKIKVGDYLLVQFIGSDHNKNLNENKFIYVCCVHQLAYTQSENTRETIFQVQGLRKHNEKGTQFSIKDNDISMINIEMVLAILPQPILIQSHRKYIYEFSRNVDVKEK